MTKVPRRKKAQRLTAGALLAKGCLNCGEKGPHYYPPGLGMPGGWICDKKGLPMTDHPAPNPNQPDALVEKAARALVQYETSGMCFPGKKCQACDCGVENMNREELAEDLRRNMDRAAHVLAAVLPEVERRAKAEALREAAEDLLYNADVDAPLPGYADLHARADQIEKGDDR